MKPLLLVFYTALLCVAVLINEPVHAQSSHLSAANSNSLLPAMPLLFTENLGQVADASGNTRSDVLFTAQSNGAKVFITATGIHYQFEKVIVPAGCEPNNRKTKDRQRQKALQQQVHLETYRFTLALQGANASPQVRKEEKSDYTENFFLANCHNGITGVSTYSRVVLENVYPGIDWAIYSKEKGLEYDFIVHPGANPALINLKVSDAKQVHIAENGDLIMTTTLGEVTEKAPISYCGSTTVPSSFRQNQDGTIGFTVSAWNKNKFLTIDPAVSWATYYGSSNTDYGYCTTVDATGNVYLAGTTTSTTGIASGGFQNTFGGTFDAFLVKFSSTGTRLWATYYGGTEDDAGYYCVTDASSNVYLTGGAGSATGIASGGFQNTFGGGDTDAFLVKFSSAGSRLWATYYGGIGDDISYSSAVDGSGNVFIGGETDTPSGLASGGFQNTFGGINDAFLVKFSSTGSRLWATYYGGTAEDEAYSCTTDASGNIFLTGDAQSTSGIASGGYQNVYGGSYDAFLAKFSSTGTRLWATYYGGSTYDDGYSCSADASGNVFLSGATESTSGIASGGFQNTFGGSTDAFLAKFSSTGTRLWATYYGSTGDDEGFSCVADAAGNVYLDGIAASTSGIASGGFQNTFGGGNADVFLVKFSGTGARLWGSYFGGSNDEEIGFCAVDGSGNVYLPGYTNSITGIASGGFQNTFGGMVDAFVAKINGNTVVPIKLLHFTAQKKGSSNLIEWQTAMETVGSRFEVEHSGDGRTFTNINTVLGKNENGASYSIVDNSPLSPITYYRMKMTERDGKITFSSIVAVRDDGKGNILVGPIPASNNITITNANALLNGTKAIVVDMQGQEIYRFIIAGASFIDVSRWATGLYTIKLTDGQILRIVKE